MRSSILFLSLALVVVACGAGDVSGSLPPDTAGPTPPTDDIAVGDWTLVEGVPMVDGFPITLSVADAQFTGRAACNQYFADYSISDGVVSVTGVGGTEMACEPEVMESESAFYDALTKVTSMRVEDGMLSLEGEGVGLLFEPAVPPPTADLVDTTWTLDSLIQGDTVSTPLVDGATLVFSSDGTLSGSTGCRELTGRWIENGGTITLPELSAEGECPEAAMAQDGHVISTLEGDIAVEIEGSVLTLTSMGGDGVVYRADS